MSDSICSPLGEPPAGWRTVTIKDIATKVGSGATPTGGANVYLKVRHRYALIRSQNVLDRSFDSKDLVFIDDVAAGRLASSEVRPGDVLLNITGDGATFSRSCMAPVYLFPACVNQHVAIVRVDPDKCEPGYLLAYLTHPQIKSYIASFNTGASRRAVTKAAIELFAIPLAPLPAQRRIAGVLSAYDDLIENNTKRIKILEEMARSLYREWFVQLRFPGYCDAECVNSSSRACPVKWTAGTLGDVLVLQRGFDLPERDRSPGAVPIVSSAGITGTHNVAKVAPPGIVTGRYGTLGDVYLLHEPFWPLNTTLYVKDLKGSDPFWALYLLRSMNFSSQNAAGAVPGVNRNALHMMPVQIPPKELQARFGEMVKPLLLQTEILGQKNRKLAAARDLLLPRLISGEIDVSSLSFPADTTP